MMKRRTSIGLTLIELFLALAVIAIIWVVATRYYQTVNLSSQVNDALSMVQAVRGASAQYAAGKPNYLGVTMAELNHIGLLPKDLVPNSSKPGIGVNPWGGDIKVAATGINSATITVTLTDVPSQACKNMVVKFQNQSSSDNVSCHGTTFTGTFG